MKKSALAALFVGAAMSAATILPAAAQDAAETPKAEVKLDSHLQAAKDVILQTNTLPPFEDQLKLITRNTKIWLIRENPNIEDEIVETVDRVSEKYKNDQDSMIKAVATVWAKYLKEDELKEILAFFKTETGQKFAQYQPRIIGESVRGIQQWSQIVTQIMVKQAKDELTKKGHKFSK
ncbi:hypothetical protein SAMN04515647_3316 [Cohaesibacter sp. ES.047]|uniref:DUF2059 domain-containing protein n=1 Tax=Cohaesibacter sp. ES.047 TaxID=1798205 RepID=UPI000BB9A3A1|nr:DUF2059 domain-containing protein [Cohaesibacter sp. ES.047]SNY93043.1 hypothetical protein SAMN04515647_3316 [Cohaesibacter sp. ES.047]